MDKIRSTLESSAVVVWLQSEVERMEVALPLLKYVGGEILSIDYWQELFHWGLNSDLRTDALLLS